MNEEIWNQYMSKRRDWREIAALLETDDLNPEYKDRAIKILMSPNPTKLPFKVNMDSYKKISHLSEWHNKVTQDLLVMAADLTIKYMKELEKASDYSSKSAYDDYQGIIPVFLERLQDEKAEELFSYFKVYNGDCQDQGYHPLRNFLGYSNIDEKWKKKAIGQLEDIIKNSDEKSEDYSNSVSFYSRLLSLMFYGNKKQVPTEFFENGIRFLLENNKKAPIIDLGKTGEAMDAIKDEELKYEFVKYQVFSQEYDGSNRFEVYDKEDEKIAKKIIKEYPDDEELTSFLVQRLEDYKLMQIEREKQKEKEIKVEQELLQKMKI